VSALRLIRFMIKTRLSGGALALLLFMAVVMLVTGLSMTFSKARSPPTSGFTEFLRGYMTLMLAILMLTSVPAEGPDASAEVRQGLPLHAAREAQGPGGLHGVLPCRSLCAMYSTTFTATALPTAFVGLERPWLAFTSLEPGNYMRSSGLLTFAQSLILNVPLALSYAVLGLVGVPGCLAVVPLLLIMVPSVALISHFLTAYFVLTPQIKFEGLATTRVSGKQLFASLLLLSVMFGMFTVPLLSALSIGGPMLSLYVSIAFLVAALPFMLTRGPWRRAALNLVEGGYS